MTAITNDSVALWTPEAMSASRAKELGQLTVALQAAIADRDYPLAIEINKKMQRLLAFQEGYASTRDRIRYSAADLEAWDAERAEGNPFPEHRDMARDE